jgi:hypothetical protein
MNIENDTSAIMDIEGYKSEPLAAFGRDVERIGPRPFDIYILPPFLVAYAVLSKRPMGRVARRILFTAGIYMGYRNWSKYRETIEIIKKKVENG